MSINSLLSNPKILDELALLIESKIPEGEPGITSLINTDNNVLDGVDGIIGNIDLEQNINITTSTINELITPNIQALNNVLNITQGVLPNQTTINLNSNNLNFSIGPSDIAMTGDNELFFADILLKTNTMNNPFSLDGSNNEVLQTDGNKNLSFVSTGVSTTGYKKYFANYLYNQTPNNGATIDIFIQELTGTLTGQTLLIEANFTFYAISDSPDTIIVKIILNGAEHVVDYPVDTFVNLSAVHTYRGFSYSVPILDNNSTLAIKLAGTATDFNVDASDYMNVLITII